MPRRLLLPLLAVLALLCAAVSAASAAPSAEAHGSPAARAAVDGLDDETLGEDDVCDPALDDEEALACEEDLYDDGDDVAELCEDGWSEDDEWSDDDAWSDEDEQPSDDDGDAELAAASTDEEDDCWTEDDEALAPVLTDLRATVTGQGRRQSVRVAFRLDEAGAVRLTLERTGGASASAKRCTAAGKGAKGAASGTAKNKGKGKGKKCGRSVTLRGSRQVAGRAGANETAIRRRWNGRALAPGSYRLTATPLGAEGESVATTFALAARKR